MKNFYVYGIEVNDLSDQTLYLLLDELSLGSLTINPIKRIKLRILKERIAEEIEYREMIRVAVRDFQNDESFFLFS